MNLALALVPVTARLFGRAARAGMRPADFPRRLLDEGIRVELEHTGSRKAAALIAADHLFEDRDYYRKLRRYVEPGGLHGLGGALGGVQDYGQPAVEAFLRDLAAQGWRNPLRPIELVVAGDTGLVEVRVGPPHLWGANTVHVAQIRAISPGGGRAALALLLGLADRHGITLTLTAKRFGPGGRGTLNDRQLAAWYMRHGFVRDHERTGELVRPPGAPPALGGPA